MPPSKSRALLDQLLDGDTPSDDAVHALVAAFQATKELEGQWFDLKSGLWLQEREAADLRKAACGFANAEGGFLLIGYNEQTRQFDGVAPVGSHEPQHWVTDVLGRRMSPIRSPRIANLTIQGKPILLVGIERAPQLVYVVEDDTRVYYQRFGHSTKPLPDSHVLDLLLGRRARPQLVVTRIHVHSCRPSEVQTGDPNVPLIDLRLTVTIENEALITARDVRIGMVAFTVAPDPHRLDMLPSQLRHSVDLQSPARYACSRQLLPWRPCHVRSANHPRAGQTLTELQIGPFDRVDDHLGAWQIPHFPCAPGPPPHPNTRVPDLQRELRAHSFGNVEMRAGLYVLAHDCEPWWSQITMRYGGSPCAGQDNYDRRISLSPCLHSRPEVTQRFLDPEEPLEFSPAEAV